MKKISRGLLISHLALVAVAIFYGVNYFTYKITIGEGFNNFEVLAFRCAVAVTVFVTFHYFFVGEKIKVRKDYLRLAICGFFGVAVNQTFFLWGLSLTSPVHASSLMITVPVFVFILALFTRQEQVDVRKILGLIVAGAGAYMLVTLRGKDNAVTGDWLGDMFIIVNACSYATYLVLVKPLVARYKAFTIVKWIFIFGGIPNIITGSFFIVPDHFANITTPAFLGLAWLILAATVGAYFLNAWAMNRLPASSVGIYIYVQPVFVALLSLFIASGSFDWRQGACMLLIFTGVFLVTRRYNPS